MTKTQELEELIKELLQASNKKEKCDICIKNKTLENILNYIENSISKEEYDKLKNENEEYKKQLDLDYVRNNFISKEVIGKYLQDIQGKYIKNIAKVEKEELLNISMPVFRGIQLEGQRKILKELLEEK